MNNSGGGYMPEIRHDPLLDRWVILSPERAGRPQETAGLMHLSGPETCPFCEGNERETPPELWALGRDREAGPDSPGWRVRVVPNRYPALTASSPVKQEQTGLLKSIQGVGAHEVIIESPNHQDGLADVSPSHLQSVLEAYRQRLRAAYRNERLAYALIFKNHRVPAGASLHHTHSQLIATPVIPQNIRLKLDAALRHRAHAGSCLLCDLIRQEREGGIRLIAETDGFVALAPFASRFPCEMMVAPITHRPDFADMESGDLLKLARLLKELLLRLKRFLKDPPYNYFLNTAPNPAALGQQDPGKEGIKAACHWHLEILPRHTSVAGFEWGSGFHINTMAPEEAARHLREMAESGGW
jgi:UDPglucose--hexose-1-phosphate uridylyltransferase